MEGFEEGYKFFGKNSGYLTGFFSGHQYISDIESEINKTVDSINAFRTNSAGISTLKGDIAEFWHAGTFNIKAAINDSKHRAVVDRSNEFGSVDVSGKNFPLEAGLKYYKNGAESAKQQAKSILERYKEYQAQGGKDSLNDFLKKRNYPDESVLNNPVYSGQLRIIPADQLKDAIAYLEKKIAKEAVNRPEQVARYKETLELLRDRISDNQGNESIPLTEADSRRIAELAKEGDFDPSEYGLVTEKLITQADIMKKAFKAGVSAALVSMVLRTAPEIMKSIDYLIQNGEIDQEQFSTIGFAAVSSAGEGFIRGTISAAITANCEAGILGSELKKVNPAVIGIVTVITMNAIQNAYRVAKGKMTRYEMTNELLKDMFVSSFSMYMGGLSQALIEIPVLGFMLGSFIGSMVGSVAYSTGYSAIMSFCVESGFTMFGLVDQDYRLPNDILEEIGIEVFDYENFDYEHCDAERFNISKFELSTYQFEKYDIVFLRRGVIGIGRVGYI